MSADLLNLPHVVVPSPNTFKIPPWAGNPSPMYALEELSRNGHVRWHRFDPRCPFLILGKDPGAAHVFVGHPTVANQHAALVWSFEDSQCHIIDLESAHGTFLDGTLIQTSERTDLQPGTKIRLGHSSHVFVLNKLAENFAPDSDARARPPPPPASMRRGESISPRGRTPPHMYSPPRDTPPPPHMHGPPRDTPPPPHMHGPPRNTPPPPHMHGPPRGMTPPHIIHSSSGRARSRSRSPHGHGRGRGRSPRGRSPRSPRHLRDDGRGMHMHDGAPSGSRMHLHERGHPGAHREFDDRGHMSPRRGRDRGRGGSYH